MVLLFLVVIPVCVGAVLALLLELEAKNEGDL